MTALAVAVTVAIVAGLLALPPLLRRGAERKLLQIRDSRCERCGEPIDPGARYVVEGKMVCGACAGRTFHRARAVLWGMVGIGVLGAVAGGVAVWARWRRGEAPSLWLDGALLLGFPVIAGLSMVSARRLSRWSNRTRLARDQAEAELYREIVDGDGPGRDREVAGGVRRSERATGGGGNCGPLDTL